MGRALAHGDVGSGMRPASEHCLAPEGFFLKNPGFYRKPVRQIHLRQEI